MSSTGRPSRAWPRVRASIALALAGLAVQLMAGTAVLAAPPTHSPSPNEPIEFAAGEVCADAVRVESPVVRARDTVFAPDTRGSQRLLTRGSGVTIATNLDSGASYRFQGGYRGTYDFNADGSIRVQFSGRDFIAWYLPGDDSELAPGLYQVSGLATEWYDTGGNFIRATYSGTAVDLCEAVGA